MKTDVREPTGDVNDFWDEFYWDDLSAGEQKLWTTLGWDQETWDDEEGEVPADDEDWDDLSEKDQAALTALGYSAKSWDA
jgi:hypothetical protein